MKISNINKLIFIFTIMKTGVDLNVKIGFPERIFFNFANNHSEKFLDLKNDLIGANMAILVQNYFSRVLFYTIASVFIGIIFAGISLFLGWSIFIPVISLFFIPLSTFIFLYTYPSIKRSSIEKAINDEIPFATIYMAAITSSDLEPTQMFRLIANSDEYPAVSIEIRKIVNQIDIYGYNLATALTNVAKNTLNERLKDLLAGMAINITSGGSLKNYLEKKSENLLMDYKLDRQKYNSLAETFMDMYISLLITAPLLLMIVFVVMSMTGFNIGISVNVLNFLIITIISGLNILFLFILNAKQPKN